MSMKELPSHWREGEEIANSITHGLGSFLSIFGAYFLIRKGIKSNSKQALIGYTIFGLSMFELYTASMLYHGVTNPPLKMALRYVDHCSVFILIAGSYTPYTLTTFLHCGGPKLLIAVWTIALLGSISKIFFFDIVFKYTAIVYVMMGWIGCVMFRNVKELAPKGIFWLVMGGVTYTAGTYFFKYGHIVAFYHAVFHIFILGGTVCHFISIYFYTEARSDHVESQQITGNKQLTKVPSGKKLKNTALFIDIPENIPGYIDHKVEKHKLTKDKDSNNYFSDELLLVDTDATNWTNPDDFYQEMKQRFNITDDELKSNNDDKLKLFDDSMRSVSVPQKEIKLIIRNLTKFNPDEEIANEGSLHSDSIVKSFQNSILPYYESPHINDSMHRKFHLYYS